MLALVVLATAESRKHISSLCVQRDQIARITSPSLPVLRVGFLRSVFKFKAWLKHLPNLGMLARTRLASQAGRGLS